MRYIWQTSLILMIILVGCRPTGAPDESAIRPITRTPNIETIDEDSIRFSISDLVLSVTRPSEWEFYTTEYGVVIAETLETVAEQGQIDGLFTHVWVPPLDNFIIPAADRNQAALILNQIINTPAYVGDAVVSQPTPFSWDGLDAAYYLMRNNMGNLTIVVGVVPADKPQLIAVSISAPADQGERIRAEIPRLFDELVIDNTTLNGASLDAILPTTLEFPTPS